MSDVACAVALVQRREQITSPFTLACTSPSTRRAASSASVPSPSSPPSLYGSSLSGTACDSETAVSGASRSSLQEFTAERPSAGRHHPLSGRDPSLESSRSPNSHGDCYHGGANSSVSKAVTVTNGPNNGQASGTCWMADGQQPAAFSRSTSLCPSASAGNIPPARELHRGNSASQRMERAHGTSTSSRTQVEPEPMVLQRRMAMRRTPDCMGLDERTNDNSLVREETEDEGSDVDNLRTDLPHESCTGRHYDESSALRECAPTVAWHAVARGALRSVSVQERSASATPLNQGFEDNGYDGLRYSGTYSLHGRQHLQNGYPERIVQQGKGAEHVVAGEGGKEGRGGVIGEDDGLDCLERKLALIELYREHTQQRCAMFLTEMDEAMQVHSQPGDGSARGICREVDERRHRRRGGGGGNSSSRQSRFNRMHGAQADTHGRTEAVSTTGQWNGGAARSVSTDIPLGSYANALHGIEGVMSIGSVRSMTGEVPTGSSLPSHSTSRFAPGDWQELRRAGRDGREPRAYTQRSGEFSQSERSLRFTAGRQWAASSPQQSQSLKHIELCAAFGEEGTQERRSNQLRRQSTSSPMHVHLSPSATCASSSPLKSGGLPSGLPLLEADILYYSTG